MEYQRGNKGKGIYGGAMENGHGSGGYVEQRYKRGGYEEWDMTKGI